MKEIGVPLNVTLQMALYDRKASSYGRATSIKNNKNELKWSTFSNNDELNCHIKRNGIVPKIGDQRSIVDYINFYPESSIDELV